MSDIAAESYGHAVVLNVSGELTEDNLSALRQAVEHQLSSQEVVDVVLNMSNVSFLDSSTLEYLLDLQDSLAQRLGEVKLVMCDENVRKILEMTRLDSDFQICDDVAEAVKTMPP